MPAKQPHPIDCHVGGRVRLRRTLAGLSQEQLGEHLGVTFQQVQKYEKGTNRISASRLWQIGEVLKAPVSFFFEGSDEARPAAGFAEQRQSEITGIAQSTEALQLLRHFTHIPDPRVRRAVAELTRALSATPEGSGQNTPDS